MLKLNKREALKASGGGEGVNFTKKWQSNSVDVGLFIVRNVFAEFSSDFEIEDKRK